MTPKEIRYFRLYAIAIAIRSLESAEHSASCIALSSAGRAILRSKDSSNEITMLVCDYTQHSKARTRCTGFEDIPKDTWTEYTGDEKRKIRIQKLQAFYDHILNSTVKEL